MFSKLTVFASLLSLAAIPSYRAAQISVTVGGTGVLAYNPPFVNANPGDVVLFNFGPANHTATQSTFDSPCSPAAGGFDSGFVPVSATSSDPAPVAQFTVQDTNPVWVYCRQANHCRQGMVFAINPGSSDQFTAFQNNAKGLTASSATAASATTTPAATGVVTVTATVTVSNSAITTTYGSYPGSAAPTAVVSSDHQVIVGGTGKLFYDPSNITAQIGDTVTFKFMQKNHTATQSSFATPCRSLTSTSTSGQIGFDSGFMPVADNATTFPTYTIQINNTSPIWVYCRQSTHCGSGMVFSVNAVESGPNNFGAFKAAAMQQNGTGTASSSSASPSSTSGSMPTFPMRSAGSAIALVAVFVALVL